MALKYRSRTLNGLELLEVPGDEGAGGVLCLHGYGADAEDLLTLSEVYAPDPKQALRPTWFFPNGPLSIPQYAGRAWFHIDMERLLHLMAQGHREIEVTFPQELTEIRTQLEQLILDLQLPPHKLFIGGFSQGAVLATEVALHAFEKLAGLMIFSGTLIHRALWQRLAPLHAGMPFFQSHGDRDPILPLEEARELSKLLTASGLKGELFTFSGGHTIPREVITHLHHFLKQNLTPH